MTYRLINEYQGDDSLVQYGDGVFETMLAVNGMLHHWHYHWARLQSSCERLHITTPDHDAIYDEIHCLLRDKPDDFSVVKMIVSRGEGLRGYRTHHKQACFIHLTITPFVPKQVDGGLNLRVCKTRLASQPLLAGMKHCNRLEYIMARREPDDQAFDEGLLLDYDNHLVEGLVSNVFIMQGKQIFTPSLKQTGVAGTMRAALFELLPPSAYSLTVAALTLNDLARAESVFLTNAIHGVLPVKRIQGIPKDFDTDAVAPLQTLTHHPA